MEHLAFWNDKGEIVRRHAVRVLLFYTEQGKPGMTTYPGELDERDDEQRTEDQEFVTAWLTAWNACVLRSPDVASAADEVPA